MTSLGAYIEGGSAGVASFEHWIGRPVDSLLEFIGQIDWQDFDQTLSEVAAFSNVVDRQGVWSVPLVTNNGTSLEAAATGAYNDHYHHAAEVLAQTQPGNQTIYVRTGWEFNGDWFAWQAAGHEQAFIAAWHQFVDTFRSVSDRFQFDWCVNIGQTAGSTTNPERAYPGDNYVDVISMDVYHNVGYDVADPNEAWRYDVQRPYGLQWHQDFAAAHGKPTSYTEWGVLNPAGGSFVEHMADWFNTHHVLYQHYWDAGEYRLSNGQFPNTAAAYLEHFGAAAVGDGTALATAEHDSHDREILPGQTLAHTDVDLWL